MVAVAPLSQGDFLNLWKNKMSVAVSCNLSEGVVLGVDSAVALPDPKGAGIGKTYENADKLFRLGNSLWG